MTSTALLLLVIGILGISTLRTVLLYFRVYSEYPAKMVIALIFVTVGFSDAMGWSTVGKATPTIGLIVSGLFIIGPVVAQLLARAGMHSVARMLQRGLYWTKEGRDAIGLYLTEIALTAREPKAAAAYGLEGAFYRSRIAFMERRYDDVLHLELTDIEAQHPLVRAVQTRAYVRLGQLEEAEREYYTTLLRYHRTPGVNPRIYPEIVLAEAEILAARGSVQSVQQFFAKEEFRRRPFDLFEVLVESFRANRQPAAELAMLTQAAPLVPRGKRNEFAERIQELGGNPSVIFASSQRVMPMTIGFAATLIIAYLGQIAADRYLAVKQGLLTIFDPSSLIAAFLLDIPFAPYAEAWWRFLTYGFVHGNLIHILMNVWVFIDVGGLLEKRRSWAHVVTSFAIGTAGGAWLTQIFDDGPLILVGASGGVLGVAGMIFADALLGKRPEDKKLVQAMIRWMALIMLISVTMPGISLFGHAGGIIVGFAWGAVLHYVPRLQRFMPVAGAVAIGVMAFALLQALRLTLPFFT